MKESNYLRILFHRDLSNNVKIAQVQIEKISSINAKLTFFVVLTIISIVVSIITMLR